jgi:hypothetical protein
MTSTSRPPESVSSDTEQADLARLADALAPHGCKTVLVTREDKMPCLDVIHPDAGELSERVYAQADFFWYAWAEVITRRDEPAAAAQAIARALRPAGE